MLWMKRRYLVPIHGGCGELKTDELHGLIQQIVVEPTKLDTVWSLRVLDRDNDDVLNIKDHEGILNDRQGLPVGKDTPEYLRFVFEEMTANEPIKVLLNIKEVK